MRIGRLLGIDIVIDASWLLIATLMTFDLTAVFMQWHPSWALAACAILAMAATVLFFLMILAHELAHALVAMTLGMKVTSIRLFLFGGVSNIDEEPPSAKGELAMAVAGPLVSIGAGVALLVASTFLLSPIDPRAPLYAFQSLGPIATLVVWLGPVNLGLGLFNLLPAFPLDGGRVLRAVAWIVTKDLDRATRFATQVSQVVGWTLVVFGAVRFFVLRETMGALWLAFIGWFIVSGARRSYESLRVQHALEGVRVGRLMRTPGPTVSPEATIDELVERILVPSGLHAINVVMDDQLVGLVTSSDVWRLDRAQWGARTVADIMTPVRALATAAPDDLVIDVLRRVAERDVTQVPVIDDGVLVGIFDARQVAVWLRLALAPEHLRRPHWGAT